MYFMTNPPQLSDCCENSITRRYSITGAKYNSCDGCQKPCDVLVEEKGEKRNDYMKMVAEQIGYLVGILDAQNRGVDNINPTKEILETSSRLNYIIQQARKEAREEAKHELFDHFYDEFIKEKEELWQKAFKLGVEMGLEKKDAINKKQL